jgi:histidinol dehydrogenase
MPSPPPRDFDTAFDRVDRKVVAAIEFAIDGIRRFHEVQKPEEMWLKEIRPGVFAGERTTPIASVACYVPRGKGAFPSVVMMTAVPAVVAGVPQIAVLTPSGPDGKVDAASLIAARLAGVEQVYKCGGAAAAAAAAYGTRTVPKASRSSGPAAPITSRPSGCWPMSSIPAFPPAPANPSCSRMRPPRWLAALDSSSNPSMARIHRPSW